MKQVEIPLSKKKMYLMLIGSIVFVLIGVWIILAQPMVRNVFFNNPIVKNVSGILAILFFGAVAISLSRKVQDNTPGLIVNEDGILDNSSAISAGFISWAEIINIEVVNIANQNFIMIKLKSAEAYIDKQSGITRKAMQINFKTYGSPISISANTLKISFEELHTLLSSSLNSDVS